MASRPPIPDVYLSITDGNIGLLPIQTAQVHAKIGPASAGDDLVITPVASIDALVAAYTGGPLVEAAAVALQLSGTPIYCVKVKSVPGVIGAVVDDDVTGGGTLAVETSEDDGSPVDEYALAVMITATGGVGIGRFQYSLDGGRTVSPDFLIPAAGTFVLPLTGLTLEFENADVGTSHFVAGDRYTCSVSAPTAAAADIQAALDVLLADPRTWGWVHVLGQADATVGNAIAARMLQAENAYRYVFAELQARRRTASETHAQWMTAVIAQWAAFANTRVGVSFGQAQLTSPLTGLALDRDISWPYMGRLAAIPVHEHPGRVIRQELTGVGLDARNPNHHDEAATLGMDIERFTTLRSFVGLAGAYVTNGRIKAAQTSDFVYVEHRRVMDLACTIARLAALRFLNDSVRVDAQGHILEQDARRIEGFVQGQLFAGIIAPGHASATAVRLDRTTNVLSSRWVRMTVRLLPLAYLSWIEVVIGFENPALTLAGGAGGLGAQSLTQRASPLTASRGVPAYTGAGR